MPSFVIAISRFSESYPLEGLCAQYIQAVKNHGNRLVWPPEFTHYLTGSKTAQEKS